MFRQYLGVKIFVKSLSVCIHKKINNKTLFSSLVSSIFFVQLSIAWLLPFLSCGLCLVSCCSLIVLASSNTASTGPLSAFSSLWQLWHSVLSGTKGIRAILEVVRYIWAILKVVTDIQGILEGVKDKPAVFEVTKLEVVRDILAVDNKLMLMHYVLCTLLLQMRWYEDYRVKFTAFAPFATFSRSGTMHYRQLLDLLEWLGSKNILGFWDFGICSELCPSGKIFTNSDPWISLSMYLRLLAEFIFVLLGGVPLWLESLPHLDIQGSRLSPLQPCQPANMWEFFTSPKPRQNSWRMDGTLTGPWTFGFCDTQLVSHQMKGKVNGI